MHIRRRGLLRGGGFAVLFSKPGDLYRRAFLIAVGASVGFAAYSLHWYGTLRYAEAWDGTEQTLQVRVMEAPAEFDYYTCLHVQRTENPKLDLMLYDYRGSIDPDLEPGRMLSVTAKLQLIQAHAVPDMELLVVGHHGSDTSTDPAFLDAVRAEQAVISVGRNNSYGHPSRQVLARLQSRGMEIYRTDRNGTVEVRVNAP